MRSQKFSLFIRAIFRRPKIEREMEAELADHLDSETEDLIRRGIPPADARRRARSTMGHIEVIKEECRDSRGTAGWEQFKQDAAYGMRVLRKNRSFSCTALATMALAIGSTTAVYSLVDGVLLRPLPFADPSRLFSAPVLGMRGTLDAMRSNSRLADYAGYLGERTFSTPGQTFPERVKGCQVSANFFPFSG